MMNNDAPESKPFTQRLGGNMVMLAWIVLLGMLTLLFNRYLERQENPNENVVSHSEGGQSEVVLQRNRYGHYVATGEINGRPVRFMLDTGATMVSVPANLEGRLALIRGPEFEVSTANGTVTVYATRLKQVRLGDIVLHDVRASINPYMDEDEILLGMSFLKQLEFTQRGDQLILRQY